MECVIAAVAGHLEGSTATEIARRFMEHSEMRFRLSYILGSLRPPNDRTNQNCPNDDEDVDVAEDAEVTEEEPQSSCCVSSTI